MTRRDIEYAQIAGDAQGLAKECLRLRQGLWDCALAAGADGDGDKTPDVLCTDVVKFALGAVKDLRSDYDVEC